MGYELAPATELMATHCCFCSRPLVDANSVQRGYGPICAEKWFMGYDAFEPAVREEINGLVYEAASIQHEDPRRMAAIAARLTELGADVAAERIAERFVGATTVDIALVNGAYEVVVHKFNEGWVKESKDIPGRRCFPRDEGGKRTWVSTFPIRSKRALWECLQRNLAGSTANGPKGQFVI